MLKNSSSAVQPALRQPAVPRKDSNIGNRVSVARDIFRFSASRWSSTSSRRFTSIAKRSIAYSILVGALRVKMTETAAKIGRTAHLPKEPRKALRAWSGLGRQEGAEFLGQVDQD